MKRSVANVPALERGLRLLEWMTGQEEAVSLTQIAEGLGLGIPEVQRPVACLESLGYLRRLAAGGYVVSGRLYAVASHQPLLHRLRATAEPLLREFATTTGHSIHLSVPDGDEALMILDVPGEGIVRISLRPGARFAVKNTLSGALLAAVGELAHPPGWKPESKILKAIKLRLAVATASQRAFGVTDIGALIHDQGNRVLGVITSSVVQPAKGKLPERQLIDALQKTSAAISSRY